MNKDNNSEDNAMQAPSWAAGVGAPLLAVSVLSGFDARPIGNLESIIAATLATVTCVFLNTLLLGPALDKRGYVHGYKLRELALGTANFFVGLSYGAMLLI